MNISVVYFRNNGEVSGNVDAFFIASRNPLYIGLIMKPSTGVWEIIKSESVANLRIGEEEILEFEIPYKIEVGENTIFFARPSGGSREMAEKIFLRSDD